VDLRSELLLDCSGQATFLAHAGVTGPKYLGSYDKQIAVFSQVAGAIRDRGPSVADDPNNTVLFYREKYHWAWFIPLDDEVTSVGVVIPAAYFLSKRESRRDFLVRELHALNPQLTRRLPEITLVEDVHVIPNYSYQVKRFGGKGFLCIGDAHRFIDPFFSFGMYVSMKEAQFAAPLARRYLEGAGRDEPNPFAEHQRSCERGIDILEDTIDMFWEQPLAFAMFAEHRYRDLMTDVLAGRVYERQPSPLVAVFRRMLGREREREAMGEDASSVPVGSRFHPERAGLWEANSPVSSTEAWLGPR
jgi:flavin-dependent dehydrogenase